MRSLRRTLVCVLFAAMCLGLCPAWADAGTTVTASDGGWTYTYVKHEDGTVNPGGTYYVPDAMRSGPYNTMIRVTAQGILRIDGGEIFSCSSLGHGPYCSLGGQILMNVGGTNLIGADGVINTEIDTLTAGARRGCTPSALRRAGCTSTTAAAPASRTRPSAPRRRATSSPTTASSKASWA